MMKLKYSICCRLDIHKNIIVATIVTIDKEVISEYNQKSFSTINSDIQKFHDWLIENNCYHVCMESTDKYWIPIFNYLENDINVCLTHPKYVKAIKGKFHFFILKNFDNKKLARNNLKAFLRKHFT